MVAAFKSVDIPPESETARLLRDIDETPTVFVVGESRYRVLRESGPDVLGSSLPDYDPQRAIDGMMAAAGSITLEEGERWIEDIYRWRREGSRPVEPPE